MLSVCFLKKNGAVPDTAFGSPPQAAGVQMYSDNKAWGGTIDEYLPWKSRPAGVTTQRRLGLTLHHHRL